MSLSVRRWIWNARFNLGYRIGGFTHACREEEPMFACRTVHVDDSQGG